MGTVFQVSVAGVEEVVAEPAIRAALEEIERLETVLSEWLPGSEITQINENAGVAPVRVGEDTLAVVRAGLEVSRWSGGAFDMSWAALRDLFDFRPGRQRIAPRREVRARLPLVRWQDILVDEEASTVFLRRAGMAIGTGGIAKGYALDRAGAILQARGVEHYMIFGGGQVQVNGRRGDRPWRVGIQHPRDQREYFASVEAEQGSISTSGDYEHVYFDAEGRRWHHILDLRTGLPATRSLSVTVLTESGIYADALSTAVFVLGPERGVAMLADLPIRVEAAVVGADLELVNSPGMQESLRLRQPLQDGRLPGRTSEAQRAGFRD